MSLNPKLRSSSTIVSKTLHTASLGFRSNTRNQSRIYKDFKTVDKLMEGSSNFLQEISKSFKDLSSECKAFNELSEMDIKSSFSYFYDLLGGLTRDLS